MSLPKADAARCGICCRLAAARRRPCVAANWPVGLRMVARSAGSRVAGGPTRVPRRWFRSAACGRRALDGGCH
eukprot:scaffold2415_cov79-Phaeocystis_antarctica.AAC.1